MAQRNAATTRREQGAAVRRICAGDSLLPRRPRRAGLPVGLSRPPREPEGHADRVFVPVDEDLGATSNRKTRANVRPAGARVLLSASSAVRGGYRGRVAGGRGAGPDVHRLVCRHSAPVRVPVPELVQLPQAGEPIRRGGPPPPPRRHAARAQHARKGFYALRARCRRLGPTQGGWLLPATH